MAKINNFIESVSKNLQSTYHKSKFTLTKHSPEIFLISGIAGTVVAFGLAIRATRKLDDVLEKGNERIESAKAVPENETGLALKDESQVRKDLAKAYAITAFDVGRLYAPSGVLLGLSITAIVGSHNIMQRRNVSLATAYATLDQAFKQYKQRVADKYGEEAEKDIRYGVKTETIEEFEEDVNGKKKKVKKKEKYVSDEPSPYAKFFDESSRCWEKDAELNLMFLRRTERYCNDILRRDGYLFLCDVYKALDIDETRESRTVGWIYDPEDKSLQNHVDFGIYNTNRKKVRDFVNGLERVVLLDFNPDGVVLDRVKYPG